MLHQYSKRIFYTDFKQSSDRPSLGYVKGDHLSLAVDAGNSRQHAREFLAMLDEKGLRRPDLVILTHYHWDHCFGLGAFDCPAIACKDTYDLLLPYARKIWDQDVFEESVGSGMIEPFCEAAMREEYRDFRDIRPIMPEILFDRQLRHDLGGVSVLIKKISNPHSDDGVMIYVEEEKVLFLGDAACLKLQGNDWVDHPDKANAMLKELEPYPFELAIVGHFDPQSREELLNDLRSRS